ncbi:unnamed protein product [Camellia sinensis]
MASILSKKKKKKKKKKNKREKYSISELKTLGHQLLSSRAHINNLPLLMSFVCSGTSPPYYALEALLSVQSFFTPILPDLPSHPQGDPQDPEFIYRTWLRSKFDDFVNSLIDIAVSPQSKEALRLHSTVGIEIFLDLLVSKYFNYIDIRYFTYITIEKLARTLGAKDISDNKIVSVDGNNKSHSRTRTVELPIHKIYRILSHIPPLEGTDEKAEHEMRNGSGVFIKEGDHKEHSQHQKDDKQNKVLSAVNIAKKMKLKFTKAWISFLRLPLPVDLYKEVLVTLHQAVIPYLSNPIMLCDFLTRSYDIGGVISVMALSSLYILMTQHGLEYPNFYEKLFALLVPSIFMAKHRAKFFEAFFDNKIVSVDGDDKSHSRTRCTLSRCSLFGEAAERRLGRWVNHVLVTLHQAVIPYLSNPIMLCDFLTRSYEIGGVISVMALSRFENEEKNAQQLATCVQEVLFGRLIPSVTTTTHLFQVEAKRLKLQLKISVLVHMQQYLERRVKQVPLAFYEATPRSLFSESDFAGWTFKIKKRTSCLLVVELSARILWLDCLLVTLTTVHMLEVTCLLHILPSNNAKLETNMDEKFESKGRVCVTGASGFIASWLIKRLLLSGYNVIGTVRDPGNNEKLGHLWRLEGAKERVELVRADLMEEGSFDDTSMGCHGVFHIAFPVLAQPSFDPKAEILIPAIEGTLNILRSCKKNPSLNRVIVTSSSSTVRARDDFYPNVPLDESSWSSVKDSSCCRQ